MKLSPHLHRLRIAQTPPSSAAIFFSTASQVGFAKREYMHSVGLSKRAATCSVESNRYVVLCTIGTTRGSPFFGSLSSCRDFVSLFIFNAILRNRFVNSSFLYDRFLRTCCLYCRYVLRQFRLLTVLLFIQRAICHLKKQLDIILFHFGSKERIPYTDGKREFFTRLLIPSRTVCIETCLYRPEFCKRHAGSNNSKFIATKTTDDVCVSELVFKQLSLRFYSAVSCSVSVRIVYFLQAVHVAVQHHAGLRYRFSKFERFLTKRNEAASVEQAGHFVGKRYSVCNGILFL